jgi:hypothetical protein
LLEEFYPNAYFVDQRTKTVLPDVDSKFGQGKNQPFSYVHQPIKQTFPLIPPLKIGN